MPKNNIAVRLEWNFVTSNPIPDGAYVVVEFNTNIEFTVGTACKF